MNNKTTVRIQKIADYTQAYLHESYQKRSKKDKANLKRYLSGVDYRWQHTLRVAQFGKVIAENEGVGRRIGCGSLPVARSGLVLILMPKTTGNMVGLEQKKPDPFWKALVTAQDE